LLIGSWSHESPARPGRGSVAIHVDLEIGQDMESISAIGPGNVLFHKRLDGRRALDRAESAHPFPVFGEKARVVGEVSGVEVSAVVEQDSLDLLDVLKPLD